MYNDKFYDKSLWYRQFQAENNSRITRINKYWREINRYERYRLKWETEHGSEAQRKKAMAELTRRESLQQWDSFNPSSYQDSDWKPSG